MKKVAVVFALLMATAASADALSRKDVERRLRFNFKSAQGFELTGMKESYWGLYRTYHVTFNLRASGTAYKVGCDLVDRRPRELDLSSCEAFDTQGQKVADTTAKSLGIASGTQTARLEWKSQSQSRMPASGLGSQERLQ